MEIDSRLGLADYLPNKMDLEGVLDLKEGGTGKVLSVPVRETVLSMREAKLLNPSFEQQGAMFNLTDVDLGEFGNETSPG